MLCKEEMRHSTVNETLAYEPDVKDPKHPKLVQEPDYIQFDDVTFSYPSSTETNLKRFRLH